MSDIEKIVEKEPMKEAYEIKGEDTIAKIVNDFPETAGVFLQYGMHCFGCGVAQYENLEQGALAHGMDKDKINSLLGDLNKVVEENYSKTE
jgi:hybrid cluster-associated redox disulfide protein